MFKFGGIYIDVDTISIRPLGHHLRKSFVTYCYEWHMICNSLFGFPQVRGEVMHEERVKTSMIQIQYFKNSFRAQTSFNLCWTLRRYILLRPTLISFLCSSASDRPFSQPHLWVFVNLYLCICICVFVFVYLYLCIDKLTVPQRYRPSLGVLSMKRDCLECFFGLLCIFGILRPMKEAFSVFTFMERAS